MKASRFPKLLSMATVAAALAFGGVAAHAEPGHGHRGGPHAMGMFGGGHVERMLDVVNATDAQRSQIDAIFKSARQDLAGQREAGKKLHQQMATLFAATNIDAAAIESLRQQLSAQHEATSKRMSQAMVEAARVLTPEQRVKIAEVMKKRHERMAHRRHG